MATRKNSKNKKKKMNYKVSRKKNQTKPKDMIIPKKPSVSRFLSRLGIRCTIQLAMVIILILIVVLVVISDIKKLDTRDKAFKQITTAAISDDYIGIIKNAETFFSKKPLTRNDKRESYVRKLYDQAIVRLFSEQGDKLDDNALAHFKQYEKLIVNSKK